MQDRCGRSRCDVFLSQEAGLADLRPIDPLVSRYPQPLSAERARFEAQQARRKAVRLPKGHPYRSLPTWFPYGLARILARSAVSSRPDDRIAAPS